MCEYDPLTTACVGLLVDMRGRAVCLCMRNATCVRSICACVLSLACVSCASMRGSMCESVMTAA